MGKLLALVGLVLVSSVSMAEPGGERVERARAHFDAGRALYSLARYDEALREFSAGYAEVPKNHFLINIGQCHRRLGDLPRAREAFRAYRDRVAPGDPDLPEVEAILRELDAALARQPPPASPIVVATPEQRTIVAAPARVAASTTGRRTRAARYWWIAPAAVVAVAGIAVGVYFGVRGGGCSANLGCSDLR